MPAVQDGLPFSGLARRWHVLAERRLTYYQELYRSGRWRHYYSSQEQFALRMLDVIRAAKIWAELAGRSMPSRPVHKIAGESHNLRPAA